MLEARPQFHPRVQSASSVRGVAAVWLLGVTAVAIFGFATIGPMPSLGPLSVHMSWHILLMNVLAPLLALGIVTWAGRPRQIALGRLLAGATLLQVIVLWSVHAPIILVAAMNYQPLHIAIQGLLFAAALMFWWTVLAQPGEHVWRSLFALLITGKLFCLLGALLVFAPRLLYPTLTAGHAGMAHGAVEVLSDQQLAGLLMLVACPLSFVLAGVVIAALWLRRLSRAEAGALHGC